MVNVNDSTNYKPCKEKQAEFWICKPPFGTVVFNKLEDRTAQLRSQIPQLSRKHFLTVNELKEIKVKNAQLFSFIMNNCSVTNAKQSMVVCGTLGELWVTSYDEVCRKYRVFSNNQWVHLSSVLNNRLQEYGSEKVLPWCRAISVSTGTEFFACFIPKEQRISVATATGTVKVNEPAFLHGKGDFLVCQGVNNTPDIRTCRVVNGLVFANTYNNKGWSDCVVQGNVESGVPQPLFEAAKVSDKTKYHWGNIKNWFKQTMPVDSEYYNSLCKCDDEVCDGDIENLERIINIVNLYTNKYGFSIVDAERNGTFDALCNMNISVDRGNVAMTINYNGVYGVNDNSEYFDKAVANNKIVELEWSLDKFTGLNKAEEFIQYLKAGVKDMYLLTHTIDKDYPMLKTAISKLNQAATVDMSYVQEDILRGYLDGLQKLYETNRITDLMFRGQPTSFAIVADIPNTNLFVAFAYNCVSDNIQGYVKSKGTGKGTRHSIQLVTETGSWALSDNMCKLLNEAVAYAG